MSGGRFDDVADGYLATMVPSLRSVAARVVARAALQPDERVLDAGTGTGIAAATARGEGRRITGIDAAEGMLALARRDVSGVTFRRMDFEQLAFEDGAFDVVIAAHALLFATDPVRALREWRRVVRAGGRLSLSVPGPEGEAPQAIYAGIYARHGISTEGRYPSGGTLAVWARAAGWTDIATEADPGHAITLPDEEAFGVWRSIGSRGAATAHWSPDQHAALTAEMLAVTPRDAHGSLRIPFGVLYLSARRAID